MKTLIAAIAILTFGVAPAAATAADTAIAAGKTLYSADGKRIAAIYKVTADGTVQVIIDGKLLQVPGSTITTANGKIETSLDKKTIVASN